MGSGDMGVSVRVWCPEGVIGQGREWAGLAGHWLGRGPVGLGGVFFSLFFVSFLFWFCVFSSFYLFSFCFYFTFF